MTNTKRAAMAVLLTAGFTLAVDFSILNVALPAIGRDVGLPVGGLQWVTTAFALCAAGFTLLLGRVADLVGRRRMFLAGMAVLGVSSLAGGLAPTAEVLLAARVGQGLATAAVTPAALALLTTLFPAGPARERALGLNGALMAAGFTTGAVLGGVLTGLLSWRWAFFLNVAVAAVVLLVAPVLLDPDVRPEQRRRLDVPGAVAVTGGLLALVHGWVLTGVLLLGTFWLIERKVAEPLVPVRVLRSREVGWGNLAGLVAFATETSLVFVLTIHLQDVLGYSPLRAGLSFAVLGLGTVLGGVVAPRVIGRAGARTALVGGLVLQAAATLPLVLLGPERPWLLVLTFAGGVANLVAIVAFMVTVTNALPAADQGLATGLATMSQQVGITVGTPVMSAVMMHGYGPAVAVDALAALATAVLVSFAVRPAGTAVRA
ncbi:MFS transporter [Actinoplanes sp. NPDC049596]|uniref:MFS transporter n=1 Tax=unclassified Actinoplanes TaxID=2626549 RepID=UPI00341CB2A5